MKPMNNMKKLGKISLGLAFAVGIIGSATAQMQGYGVPCKSQQAQCDGFFGRCAGSITALQAKQNQRPKQKVPMPNGILDSHGWIGRPGGADQLEQRNRHEAQCQPSVLPRPLESVGAVWLPPALPGVCDADQHEDQKPGHRRAHQYGEEEQGGEPGEHGASITLVLGCHAVG